MKVVVVGVTGQLGNATAEEWRSRGHDVVGLRRSDLDVTAQARVMSAVRALRPHVLINCTAFNDVDGAEDAPQLALSVNAWAVRSLARAVREVGAILVHYGTDFVFDGDGDRPYVESDSPNPVSVYGVSKLLGEWFARDCPRHYVLRVESLFGGRRARGSTDRIVEAIRGGRPAPVFFDRTVSPSLVDDVVEATRFLVEADAPDGLYHCVNSGVATWLDVGREIAALLGQSEDLLQPTSVHDVRFRAARPTSAALSNSKLARAGFTMPTWRDALRRHLESGCRQR